MSSAPLSGPVRATHLRRRARRYLPPLAVVLTVLVAQLLPHPPNVAPIRAAALFGGARFRSAWTAFLVPLGAQLLGALGVALLRGDASYGFHALAPVVYGCVALNVLLGLAIRARSGWLPVSAATVGGSLLFFLLTNFAVWLLLGTYPPTAEGLARCYTAGLPFLASGLLGDAAYAALFFGGLVLLERSAMRGARQCGVA